MVYLFFIWMRYLYYFFVWLVYKRLIGRLHVKFFYWYFFPVHFRKKKAVHKTTTTDDKRLQSTLKRIGVNAIPAIEEVNIFKDDVVIQFLNPKGNINWWYLEYIFYFRFLSWLTVKMELFAVQASIAANTWVVSGAPQTKSKHISFSSFLYAILSNLGCAFYSSVLHLTITSIVELCWHLWALCKSVINNFVCTNLLNQKL